MTSIKDNVKKWISTLGWNNVVFYNNDTFIQQSLVGDNGDFLVLMLWNDDESNIYYFEVFTHCPIKIPPEKREKIAEFLMTINSNRRLSHFTIDYETGEVLSVSVLYSDNMKFSDQDFQLCLNISMNDMDTTFPLITKLIFSETTVEQAMKEWADLYNIS